MINGVTSIVQKNPAPGVIVRTVPNALRSGSSTIETVQYPTDFWGSYTIK